jgi:hypothetical protein
VLVSNVMVKLISNLCRELREDKKYIVKHGHYKAFLARHNSTCHYHI